MPAGAPLRPLRRPLAGLALAAAVLALAACEDLPATVVVPAASANAPAAVPAKPEAPKADASAPPAKPAGPPPVVSGGWDDPLDAHDKARWGFADGWANGFPFDCGWRRDHGAFLDGQVVLSLSDTPASGKRHASGELRSKDRVGYGRVEGRIRAARASGVVTSFITYTGPEENTPHDEIDFEFLGKATGKVQLNYFVGGKGGHEKLIDLGFDAAAGFHDYAFEWAPDGIAWFVDGREVHRVTAANGPLPANAGHVIANVWPAAGADVWSGPFTYPGSPITAAYDRIAFTPR